MNQAAPLREKNVRNSPNLIFLCRRREREPQERPNHPKCGQEASDIEKNVSVHSEAGNQDSPGQSEVNLSKQASPTVSMKAEKKTSRRREMRRGPTFCK